MMDCSTIKKEFNELPTDRTDVLNQVDELLQTVAELRSLPPVTDERAIYILEIITSYLKEQLERMKLLIDEKIDIIAWISRNLSELYFILRYIYKSDGGYEEIIKEQLTDLKELEDIILQNGTPSVEDSEDLQTFSSDMNKLWHEVQGWGIAREDLGRPNQIRHYAEIGGTLSEYQATWRIHSKYVHPTSYLLFGRKDFVFADEVTHFFRVLVREIRRTNSLRPVFTV